jgi:phage terminase small subunit
MSKLNPRQERFVEEYLVDLNATRAADRAGYRHPDVQGPRLLGHVGVATAIQARRARLSKKLEVTQERVLQELARIAFADVRDLFTWDEERSCYVPSANLTDDQAAAVAAVEAETTRTTNADGVTETKIKLKLKTYDKKGALDSLAKHLGMFVERVEHSGEIGGVLVVPASAPAEPWSHVARQQQAKIGQPHGNGNGNGNGNRP